MKIKKVQIDGFGILHGVDMDMSPGMNIVFGSNESGKSTIFEFIHRILFGFPRGKKKKDYNPYASISQNKTGGRLIIDDAKAGQFTIERFDGDKTEDAGITYSNGTKGYMEDFLSILGPITPDMYRDIFAFGLNELWDLREESLKRFYGAGLGLKNVFVSDILNTLNNKSQEIFKTSRGETEIRKNLAELAHIKKEIHTLYNQKQQYDELILNLNKIEQHLISLKRSHDELQRQNEHYILLKKAHPLWIELMESEKELASLPLLPDLPQQALFLMEKALEQYKESGEQEKTAKDALARVEAGYNEIRGRIADTLPDLKGSSPESLLDLFDEYQKKISLVIVLLSSLKEKNHRMETFEERKTSLQNQLTMAQMTQAPPIHTAYLPGLTANIALVVTGFVFMALGFGYLWPGVIIATAIVLSLVYVISTRRKLKIFREGQNLFEPLRKEIDTCERTITSLKTEIEAERIEIEKHAKKIGLSALPTIEELENKRVIINRLASQSRDYIKDNENLEFSLSEIGIKKEKSKRELEQLLKAGDASDMESFRNHAVQKEKRVQLEETVKSAKKNLLMLGCKDLSFLKEELGKISIGEIDTKLSEFQDKRKEQLKILEVLRKKEGELLEQKRMLEMDRIPELRWKQEQASTRLHTLGRKWCTYRLAAFLLQKAREKYEKEKQPRVLSEAGVFFNKMTNERYQRIGFSPEEKAFVIFDSQDKPKDPVFLSRGTREQLYLSIRFGLIKSFASSDMIFPVITDDILVNFDPERARGAAGAFCELAGTHQILFFTCHPETVELFKNLTSEYKIHSI